MCAEPDHLIAVRTACRHATIAPFVYRLPMHAGAASPSTSAHKVRHEPPSQHPPRNTRFIFLDVAAADGAERRQVADSG